MSRGSTCHRRPAVSRTGAPRDHCDHDGTCCWCGEPRESEHGPHAPWQQPVPKVGTMPLRGQ